MRVIEIKNYDIVIMGRPWTKSFSPCSKEATAYLESNESIVTWITPKNNRHCSAHIPTIMYRGQFWNLSLRMSKCIYRHVRLKKGFANIQTLHGVETLRIPSFLLMEKRRTQQRFEKMHASRRCTGTSSNSLKKVRVEKPKADARLLAFIEKDIPEMVKKNREKPEPSLSSRPMYSDLGVFLQGVLDDLNFVFPNCKDHRGVLIHALKNCKPDKVGSA